jgi:hypothetical protein
MDEPVISSFIVETTLKMEVSDSCETPVFIYMMAWYLSLLLLLTKIHACVILFFGRYVYSLLSIK